MIRPKHVLQVLLCSAAANARTIVVHHGGSIRAALAAAHPGDTVEVAPGVYVEGSPGDLNALTVTTPNLRLVGHGGPGAVVLQNAGQQQFGVWVSPENSAGPGRQDDPEKPPCGDPDHPVVLPKFTIENFTIRGFAQHGVHLACVEGFRIANNVSKDNHVYGLFPVLSRDGVVTGNLVSGTDKDAGIYVGQSDWVTISDNRASGNLLGLEVENSRNCEVIGNELTGNTLGIIVDVLTDKIKTTQESTVVAFNRVRQNNRINTAEPDDIIALLPPGIGILLLGADTSTVHRNDVKHNAFAGIAVVSLCLAFELRGEGCPAPKDLGVEPNPDGNRIIQNDVVHNATVPTGTPLDALMGDLVWDGSGSDNCWSGNRTTPHTPQPPLPACK
ncbi:MAG TPA: NosD domain-containing protein [Myxococcales bacterium]|jgi:parallel beta-helix repeat protein|nr:NosD domain-containing protein [Myxococcales bacterium]